jgi:subtilisin-like proprotein convertase family protein
MKRPSKYTPLLTLFISLLTLTSAARAQDVSATLRLQADQYRVNRLAPGETSGQAVFTVDRADNVKVHLIATVGGLTTSIAGPGGQVLTPATVAAAGGIYTFMEGSDAPGFLLLEDGTSGFHYIYEFPSLGPGTYTVSFAAAPNLAAEVGVVSQLTTDSPIGVKLFANENEVVAGRPALLTAAVFDGSTALAGAGVSVKVQPAAGTLFDLALLDNGGAADGEAGDGLYSGEFTPAAPGVYLALATVTGTTPGGVSYTRQSATRFVVVGKSATLTGVVQDQALDDDGDGLSERVALNVQAQATLAGDYRAFVLLRTARGQSITRSGEAHLSGGLGSVEVNFEAPALIALGEDGPYSIERVELLYLAPDGARPADVLSNLGQTQPYQLTQLQRPSLVFTGQSSSTGLDHNGNGKYDLFKVQVEVLVRYPGFYQWSGVLADASGAEIDFVGSDGFLNAGSNFITFTYDGRQVGRHGVSGPYNVRNVLLFGANEQSIIADRLLNTPAFSYKEFEDSDNLRLGGVTATETDGDLDNSVEPGEDGSLVVRLSNVGAAAMTNLSATLTSSTPGVTITSGVSAYPDLGASATAANAAPFTFSLGQMPCGQKVEFKLTVTHAEDGGVPSVIHFSVQTGGGSQSTYSYAGPPAAIPDANATGVSVPLTVSGFAGNIEDLNFRFDGASCTPAQGATTVGLDHSWVGDLVVTLTSPQGTTVTLMNRPGNGGDGNNFCHTTLDDEGGASIQSIDAFGAPYSGTYTPTTPLAAFRGQNPNGTWTLRVADFVGDDTGSVRAFSLAITGSASCADNAAPKTTAARANAPNAAGWNNTDAVLSLTAADNKGGSGVRRITYSATGAGAFAETTVEGSSVSLTVTTEGVTTVNFRATDNAGNVEQTKSVTVMLDKTAPSVSIISPSAVNYMLNQAVAARYACADGGSGTAACVGTAPDGGAVNTSTVGARTFTVNATDVAGNAASASVAYNVVNSASYNIRLLYDPTKANRAGSTVPVKLQVLNALSGQNVSSSNLVVHALGVTKESEYAPGPVEDAGNANPDDDFRFNNFDGTGGYIFNLKTDGLTTGTYVLVFRVGNDSFTYGARFQVK